MKLKINGGEDFLELKKVGVHLYLILGTSLTDDGGDYLKNNVSWCYSSWDAATVENLDGTSDVSQCFGFSECLRFGETLLTTGNVKARNIGEIKKALKHVRLSSYCPGDI